jgi:hypothetical protein
LNPGVLPVWFSDVKEWCRYTITADELSQQNNCSGGNDQIPGDDGMKNPAANNGMNHRDTETRMRIEN